MKKLILFIIILAFAVLCCGFAIPQNTMRTELYFDGKKVFYASYDIKFPYSSRLYLLYGGDVGKMYESKFSGNPYGFLGKLNPSIVPEITSVCEKFDKEAKEPSAAYLGDGEFSYAGGENGLKTDVYYVLDLIAKSRNSKIDIKYDYLYPALSDDDVKAATVKIAEYSTSYKTSSANRRHNVELAAAKLDGAKIDAGGSLSFNGVVGERTVENGFLNAKIILDGEYVEGTGGGVCQVSTTLFCAALYGGLDTDSRNHSLPSSYVPAGFDAMVTSVSDLVLRNPTDSAVYVDSSYKNSILTFSVYGKKSAYEIKVDSVFVSSIPCREYETVYGAEKKIIREPKNGSVYKTVRSFLDGGKTVAEESVRMSYYIPQKGKMTSPDVISEN
jgi:vancomycin resistance protein YoaR